MFSLLMTASLLAAAPEEKAKEPAAKKELFAKEEWYKSQEGKEVEFVGVLKYAPRKEGIIGFGRFNPYRLEMGGKDGVREVYIGGQEKILVEYNGRKVKLIGKSVIMEVEGRVHSEIWAARVELVGEKEKTKDKPAIIKDELARANADKAEDGPKVIAKASGAIALRSRDAGTQVIRSAEELAKATGEDAEKAVKTAATRFKVEKIDFDKQMIVSIGAGPKPTGGYSVEVTGVELKEKKLVIKWKLNSPGANDFVTQAFTYPAASIIVDKFAGDVVFDPEVKGKGKDVPKRGIDNLKKE